MRTPAKWDAGHNTKNMRELHRAHVLCRLGVIRELIERVPAARFL